LEFRRVRAFPEVPDSLLKTRVSKRYTKKQAKCSSQRFLKKPWEWKPA